MKRFKLYDDAGTFLAISWASCPAIAIGAHDRAAMALWAPA